MNRCWYKEKLQEINTSSNEFLLFRISNIKRAFASNTILQSSTNAIQIEFRIGNIGVYRVNSNSANFESVIFQSRDDELSTNLSLIKCFELTRVGLLDSSLSVILQNEKKC